VAKCTFDLLVPAFKGLSYEDSRAKLQDGILTVYEGATFDGATGIPDTHGNFLASVVHDALYHVIAQLLEFGDIEKSNYNQLRKLADVEMYAVMKAHAPKKKRVESRFANLARWAVYTGLRPFA
jgi:hypothetical protein